MASEHLQERLAEAASFAVLRRIAPVLRHDVAGFMQPIGMMMMVLLRRVQAPEPDLQEIAKNVASASVLTKDATSRCMNAMDWMASRGDISVGLRRSVDEVTKLLAVEFLTSGLQISNDISNDDVTVPASFFRSVVTGALLAFCDQRTGGSVLQISLESKTEDNQPALGLMLRMQSGKAVYLNELPLIDRSSRSIDWSDVDAMAGSFGIAATRGIGWLGLDLPNPVFK